MLPSGCGDPMGFFIRRGFRLDALGCICPYDAGTAHLAPSPKGTKSGAGAKPTKASTCCRNRGGAGAVSCGMKRISAVVLAICLPLAGCSMSVDQDKDHDRADVQIRTPVGHVFVRTGDQVPETGLAVYPGSTPVRGHREAEAADVSVGNSLFGVKVAAVNYFTDASPSAVLNYYRDAMRAHGQVTECRGNIDFKRSRPVCHRRLFSDSRATQLAVGTEERHRLVSVKPRGNGSEYSVVYVQLTGES